MKINELKKLYAEYVEAEAISDAADAAYEADCENEAVEAEFDRTYKEAMAALGKLVDGIVAFTNGAIDKKTARMMVIAKKDRLEAILNRAAEA